MVDGDVLGTPYRSVCSLAEWADQNWGYLDGILVPAGITVESLSFARVLNHAYSVLVNEAAQRGVSRDGLDELLRTNWGRTTGDAEASADDAGLAQMMGGITMDDLLAADAD